MTRTAPSRRVASLSFAPIDRTSRTTPQVYRAVRDAIVSLAVLPHESINENDVAVALGISRTPVREAFVRLVEEGLLVSLPQRGTFVAPISKTAISDAQFLREAVECAVAERAAERCDETGAATLADLLKHHRHAHMHRDLEAFHELDERTHHAVFAIAGVSSTWSSVLAARAHLDRVRRLELSNAAVGTIVLEAHAAFIAAIVARDALTARTAMREHLRHILTRMNAIEASHPELFEHGIGVKSRPSLLARSA